MTRLRRTSRRWDDDFGISRGAGGGDREGVIGRVCGETFNISLYAVDEIKSSLRIVGASVSQRLSDDHALSINTEMKLLPATSAAASILGSGPLAPDGPGVQESAASGANQGVMSPRCTSARSYSAQLLTWYFVLYLGWTLDTRRLRLLLLRMWRIGPKGLPRSGQLANFLYDSCTNAATEQ